MFKLNYKLNSIVYFWFDTYRLLDLDVDIFANNLVWSNQTG